MHTAKRLVRPLAMGTTVAFAVPALALLPGATANAATKDTGDAGSVATILKLRVGSDTIRAVVAELKASTIVSPASAVVNVVPVQLNDTKVGEQTVTNNSKTIGSQSRSVAGLVSLTSPSLGLEASSGTSGPVAKLASTALGSASVLGLSVPIDGKLGFGSSVVSKTSDASKLVRVDNLRLPSLADLLAKLGLNLSALPVEVLQKLVKRLDLVTNAISGAIDNVSDATADLDDALATVTTRTNQVASATSALNAALAAAPFNNPAVQLVLGATPVPTTAAQWNALSNTLQNSLVTALNLVTAGTGTAIQTAETALAAAQAVLATAQALVTTLTNTLSGLVSTLTSLLINALDTPLVSLGKLQIGTIANAGAKHVAKVTGKVSGLKVLGTDVLDAVLGQSSIDVVDLLGGALSKVQNTVDSLTSTVSDVLSDVAGLEVALPKVTVLEKTTSKAPSGGYQAATTGVIGLAVSWNGITRLPLGLAVPNAVALPAVGPLGGNTTALVSEGLDVEVANLTDQARYLAAGANTPTTVTPGSPNSPNSPNTPGNLPTTGASAALAAVALSLIAAAFGIRRFRNSNI